MGSRGINSSSGCACVNDLSVLMTDAIVAKYLGQMLDLSNNLHGYAQCELMMREVTLFAEQCTAILT